MAVSVAIAGRWGATQSCAATGRSPGVRLYCGKIDDVVPSVIIVPPASAKSCSILRPSVPNPPRVSAVESGYPIDLNSAVRIYGIGVPPTGAPTANHLYAIGRGVEIYDSTTIERLTVRMEKNDGSLRELIQGIIESAPFQKRRGDD